MTDSEPMPEIFARKLSKARRERDNARAERDALAAAIDPPGDCLPNCDCGGHVGGKVCGCHVTGEQAREWIRGLDEEVDAMLPVVEMAQRFAAVFHATGWDSPQLTAVLHELYAVVLAYEGAKSREIGVLDWEPRMTLDRPVDLEAIKSLYTEGNAEIGYRDETALVEAGTWVPALVAEIEELREVYERGRERFVELRGLYVDCLAARDANKAAERPW